MFSNNVVSLLKKIQLVSVFLLAPSSWFIDVICHYENYLFFFELEGLCFLAWLLTEVMTLALLVSSFFLPSGSALINHSPIHDCLTTTSANYLFK